MKNPVAKFSRVFNTAAIFRDRKKDDRRGKVKHKNRRDTNEQTQPSTTNYYDT